jgi:hypothetical protein
MTKAADVTRVEKQPVEARLIMDAHGQIREANAAAHRLLHYTAGTLVGLSLAWIMPPSRHTLLRELLQALRDGARISLPGVLMRDDSSLILVMMTANPCTGPRGHELALSFELDDHPMTAVRRIADGTADTLKARASSSVGRRQSGSTVAASASGALSPARPTRLSARPPMPPGLTPSPVQRSQAQQIDVARQLAACMELLNWLDCQLQKPGGHETTRDLAVARMVLQEASQLVEHCHNALRSEPLAPRSE